MTNLSYARVLLMLSFFYYGIKSGKMHFNRRMLSCSVSMVLNDFESHDPLLLAAVFSVMIQFFDVAFVLGLMGTIAVPITPQHAVPRFKLACRRSTFTFTTKAIHAAFAAGVLYVFARRWRFSRASIVAVFLTVLCAMTGELAPSHMQFYAGEDVLVTVKACFCFLEWFILFFCVM